MTITADNYEEYLMLYADGELPEKEQQVLLAFLEANPGLKQELRAIESARVVADSSLVYAHKSALLKEERRAIPILPIVRNIAAAVPALAFFASMIWVMTHTKTKETVASIADTPKTTPASLQTKPEPDRRSTAAFETSTAPILVHKSSKLEEVSHSAHKLPGQNAAIPSPSTTAQNIHSTMRQAKGSDKVALSALAIGTIISAQVQKMELTVAKPMEIANMEGEIAAESDSTQNGNWIDKLPLDEVKKEKLAIAAKAIENGLDQVSNLKQNLRDKNVTIRIRAKKIIVSF